MKTKLAMLQDVVNDIGDCQRCRLCETRTNIVHFRGNPESPLMFVGEAPGEDEDIQGLPFVGKAGQLLDKMALAIGYNREWIFVANIIKCRPPGNRYPEKDEVATCKPFIIRQINVTAPAVLVTLGNLATKTLLDTDVGITRLRGKWQKMGEHVVMPTFHPSYLLRDQRAKPYAIEDLKMVHSRLVSLGYQPPLPIRVKL